MFLGVCILTCRKTEESQLIMGGRKLGIYRNCFFQCVAFTLFVTQFVQRQCQVEIGMRIVRVFRDGLPVYVHSSLYFTRLEVTIGLVCLSPGNVLSETLLFLLFDN